MLDHVALRLAAPLAIIGMAATPAAAAGLLVTYPSPAYQTASESIFFIGTAPPGPAVTVNGQIIERSAQGHFAPSFGLKPGENVFVVRYGGETQTFRITRVAAEPAPPQGAGFAPGTLAPTSDLARPLGEPICLSAVAAPGAIVTAKLGGLTIPLLPQAQAMVLPDNKGALTQKNQPIRERGVRYQACWLPPASGSLGQPVYTVTLAGRSATQAAPGHVVVTRPDSVWVAQVTSEAGVARTGPSTDYSRLTPLPRGVQAQVTGQEGDWLRLDYGGWINRSEVSLTAAGAPPSSMIRSAGAKSRGVWTDVTFPLQMAVPVSVQEGEGTFTLLLHDTTAQTDIIHVDDDPLIAWLEWSQDAPGLVRYTFHLKRPHTTGYKLSYTGTSLVLSLRHPPEATSGAPLSGVRIVLDPGHGGDDDPGTTGPTGAHEKDFTLLVGRMVRDRLLSLGAEVVMTREADRSVGLKERTDLIAAQEPDLSVSLHYNALPDNGDPLHTRGVGAFWYNPASFGLAAFMHRYLTERLGRPSYGLFWDNLALTRPAVAPAVLLELGFLTNPEEFEWVSDPGAQRRLAAAIADGLAAYMDTERAR